MAAVLSDISKLVTDHNANKIYEDVQKKLALAGKPAAYQASRYDQFEYNAFRVFTGVGTAVCLAEAWYYSDLKLVGVGAGLYALSRFVMGVLRSDAKQQLSKLEQITS